MPRFAVSKVQDALNDHAKPVKGSRILVLGVAYKPDIDDLRESPALDVIGLLMRKGRRSELPRPLHRPPGPRRLADGQRTRPDAGRRRLPTAW